jgi:nucleoredoxin
MHLPTPKSALVSALLLLAALAPSVAPSAYALDMKQELSDKLVTRSGSKLAPVDESTLDGVKLYGIYSSAAWCGPCRAFTPDLVRFYSRMKPNHPEFEIIFKSSDRSEADMVAYMKDDRMKWPALKYQADTPVNQFSGNGIPCLVVVDENGKVLSHSYVNGKYVGPRKVMDDLEKLLKENPPTASSGGGGGSSVGSGSSSFDEFFKKK